MAIHSQDEALKCRVFPSSLGPMPMRWFDGLRTNSISSFKKLTQSFYSRFITCSKVPQPLDSILSMSMKERESIKAYAERYLEMFNELINTRGLKTINNKGKGKLRLSLRKEGILGRTDTATTG